MRTGSIYKSCSILRPCCCVEVEIWLLVAAACFSMYRLSRDYDVSAEVAIHRVRAADGEQYFGDQD
ncbi:hypothetical protein SORBI_3001G255450 [Sorghum bicolor]|uniref:Uncharacterized protein n=1 Tax=Sorghum bicolor TaxID=4558 RepID=A0A1Z5S7C5_SORBI|nr:hypothetical protein SORBI_3001G255450 [Sorghum bicolor]